MARCWYWSKLWSLSELRTGVADVIFLTKLGQNQTLAIESVEFFVKIEKLIGHI